jgi:hypothetical protein
MGDQGALDHSLFGVPAQLQGRWGPRVRSAGLHGRCAMTTGMRTGQGAARTAGVLAACLVLAVAAVAMDLPVPVRTLLGLPGMLLAPGYAWLTVAAARIGDAVQTPTRLVLAVVLSVAMLPLVGVTLHAVGLPVSPLSMGVGLLIATLPPTIWALRFSRADVPPTNGWFRGLRSRPGGTALVALSVGVFVAAVAWGASWQEPVDSGPFSELSYAGVLQDVDGPMPVAPGETVTLPVQLERSDGRPWAGAVTVAVEGDRQVSRPVRANAGSIVSLQVTAPSSVGLHDVVVTAVREDTGETLDLTLRLRVGQP